MTPHIRRAVQLGASLALLFVTACGSGDDWTPPQTQAEAEEATRRTALQPEQWGKGFERADDYEVSEMALGRPGKDCRWHRDPDREQPELVGLARNVHISSPDDPDVDTAHADSTVLVHDHESTARSQVESMRDAVERCESWEYSEAQRYGDIRPVSVEANGADEVLAWSATARGAGRSDDGDTTDWHVTEVMARKGPVVLNARITGAPDAHSTDALRNHVASAIDEMVARLTSEG
ncbi:hypothetical protein QMZ92_21165 [Streptomyces sp. HNM0645]|uniref:hypothetical protein n=1 Tax=Streptomyces sp. HNM0645 TaxID=2782343 RepID=UPI0024B76520|nr:hypothetical protein [Streptomyces sp. HNM0645]MDI9886811.1 hypothetical protein [Streptomyces sp. HNM0645]